MFRSGMRTRQDAGHFIAWMRDGDEGGPANGRECAVRASTDRPDDLASFGLLAFPTATAREELAGLGLVRNVEFMPSLILM
jgi:hypothetical protein